MLAGNTTQTQRAVSTAIKKTKRAVPTPTVQPNPDTRDTTGAARAEAYKKTADYAKNVRAAYAAAPVQQRKDYLQHAEMGTIPYQRDGATYTHRTREGNIVLGEHMRRMRQQQAAQQAHEHPIPGRDDHRDLSIGESYAKQQGLYQPLHANDPWWKVKDASKAGMTVGQAKTKGMSGSDVLNLANIVTNPNNILNKAGHLSVGLMGKGLELATTPAASAVQAATGIHAKDILKSVENFPVSSFNDAVDIATQAVPSWYMTGDALLKAAHGDNSEINQQLKGVEQLLTPKGLEHHPLMGLLIAKGGASAIGKTLGTTLRTAGRTPGLRATPFGKAASSIASTDRAPLVLSSTGEEVSRRYSKDLSRKATQMGADFARGKLLASDRPTARKVSRFIEHHQLRQAVNEEVGWIEAQRRYNREKTRKLLSKAHFSRDARDLVPLVYEGTVLSADRIRGDLQDRLKMLQDAAKELKTPNEKRLNSNMQTQITNLLGNDKLMAKPDRAFKAARALANRQHTVDRALVRMGHLATEQARKARYFGYAIKEMGATHDKEPRLTTAGKAMEAAQAHVEETAKARDAAQSAYSSAVKQEAYVRGGAEVKVAHADQQAVKNEAAVKATWKVHKTNFERVGQLKNAIDKETDPLQRERLQKQLDQARRQADMSRAAHQTARDTAGERLQQPVTRPQGELSSKEAKTVSSLGTKPHSALVGIGKRAAKPVEFTDAEHAILDSYRAGHSVADIAAAHDVTEAKVSNLVAKARKGGHEVPYRSAGAKARAERTKAATVGKSSHLEGARADLLLAEHRHKAAQENLKAAKAAYRDAIVPKGDRTFIPGLVDKHGQPLSSDAIEAHMRAQGINPEDIGFMTHRDTQSVGYIGTTRHPYEKPFTRTGESYRKGLYEANFKAMSDSMIRSQGILDAIHGRQQLINRFGVTRSDGSYYRNLDQAIRAAKNIKEHDPHAVDMVPMEIADRRLTTARLQEYKKGLDPGVLNEFMDELSTELANSPVHAVADEIPTDTSRLLRRQRWEEEGLKPGLPSSRYVLIPRVVAEQIKEHDAVLAKTAADKWMSAFTQRWRSSILYANSVVRWTFGNVAEMILRLGVAGANPLHYVTGRRVLNAVLNELVSDPLERARLRNILLSGGHFEGTGNLHVLDYMRNNVGELRKLMSQVAEHPQLGTVDRLWNGYKKIILGFNRFAEEAADTAAIGKLAHEDLTGLKDFNQSFRNAIYANREAIRDVAKGLLETPEQVRYARYVQQTIGKYTNLSPSARRIVNQYSAFGMWYGNALKFIFITLPAEHPILTGLTTVAYQGTSQQRQITGNTLSGNGSLPGYLQTDTPVGPAQRLIPFAHYTPFGAMQDIPANAVGQLLPQYQGIIHAFQGQNFTGNQIKLKNGKDPSTLVRLAMATYAELEGMAPFAGDIRRIREEHGKPYFDSTIFSPRVKPGTQTNKTEALMSIINPLTPVKRPAAKGSNGLPKLPSLPGPPSLPGLP